MRALEVWLQGKPVGRIAENRRGAKFEYSPQIVQAYSGRPLLSLALPVKRKPFGEAKTRNWFEGLLPEGERKVQACRQLGIDPYDWIGLLSEIGWECAGAVQVFPEGAAECREAQLVPLDEAELAEKLLSIPVQQPAAQTAIFRMSLGGYQDKLCVAMPPLSAGCRTVSPKGAALPQGGAASTHILKPEPEDYPDIAESEAWAMTAAGFAAKTSRVALLELEAAPKTLVVERYDRSIGASGEAMRLHQEDACQALGLPIERKYASSPVQKGDDPTYQGIAGLLARFSEDPKAQLEELLRQLTVNLALGNWDAHAKNTSLLYPEPMSPVVAPLYDVVPIAEVEPRTKMLSMRVNGTLDPTELDGACLIAEAGSWGLGEAEARNIALSTLDKLEAGIDEASRAFPDAAQRHRASAMGRIRKLKRMN